MVLTDPGTLLDYVQTPARQASVLREVAHRSWPLPDGPWIQAQTWDHLLFAHWRVSEAALRELVPDGLELDAHDGSAWLGVTPFRVTRFRLRGTLPVPVLSSFLELNVRTYVTLESKPGIWFFSLDAESPLAVRAAHLTYRLPYHDARMRATRSGERIDYQSERTGHAFEATYSPIGPAAPAKAGTLDHFLTERYCLYTEHRGRLHRAEIHHPPWPLQPAEAEIRENTMAPVALDGEPLLHYSERQDVVIWPLEEVQEAAARSASASAR